MLATQVVIAGPRDCHLAREEIDLWRLEPGHVIVRAERSLISVGTEMAVYSNVSRAVGGPARWDAYPYRPGYALVGQILATGDGVADFRIGDRILCFGKHASLQLYDVSGRWANATALKLGAEASARDALLGRMARIGVLAVRRCRPDVGPVAVFGLGLIGLLTIALLRNQGIEVVAFGRPGARARRATVFGAQVVTVQASEQVSVAMGLTHGRGFGVVIEASGAWEGVLNATRVAIVSGTVLLVGTPKRAPSGAAGDAWLVAQRKSLQVHGLHEWGRLPLSAADVHRELVEAVAALRDIATGELVSHVIRPEEVADTYAEIERAPDGFAGIVINWA